VSEGTRKRWQRGGYEDEIRITVTCMNNRNHAKTLRFDRRKVSFEEALQWAAVLDGTGPCYIMKPGELSPIGKCAVCGGALESSVEERAKPCPV
jgi:hypothetical protein